MMVRRAAGFGSGKYTEPKGLEKMRQEELELGWKWKAGDRSKRTKLTKSDPAALFIDRNLQLLKPGGRLLIVVPDGILCNSSDAHIREYIMGTKDEETGEFLGGKAIVKAVVSLPERTFSLAGTDAKTSFMYLQKKLHAADKQGPIFFALAEHIGYGPIGAANALAAIGMAVWLSRFARHRSDEPEA